MKIVNTTPMKKHKRSISFILPDLNGGGAQRMLLNMAIEFARRGSEVDMVVLCPSEVVSYAVDCQEGLNFIFLNRRRALFALPDLVRYFRKKEADHIITALTYVNLISVLAKILSGKKNSKIYVTERAYHSINARMTTSLYKVEKLLIRLLYPRANKVVGISNGVSADIQKTGSLSEGAVCTIYNPVITPEFKNKENEKIDHSWFSLGKSSKKIIACGRLVPVKDYQTLIEAYALLSKQLDVELGILGEGPLKAELIELTKQHDVHDKVHFLGFSHTPLPFLKHADLFALTSLSEGFGNVIVEALYCGTSVVSTDCPSGPQEILCDGLYGALVPIKSPKALAEAMHNALLNPMDSNDLKKRAQSFSVSESCDAFEKLFA